MYKSKYLAIHKNKCRPQDILGIDYHWCGKSQGGTPNIELRFDPATGDLIEAVFIPEGTRWSEDDSSNKQQTKTQKRRFILMREDEAGFDSIKQAKKVAQTYKDGDKYRVVEILVDPVTEKIADNDHIYELECAYERGKNDARAEIKSKLGL